MNDTEGTLLRYLQRHCSGKRNAQSAPVIAGEFRTTERNVRAMMRSLRLQGNVIAGIPTEGFYWPLTRDESEHTLLYLLSQERAIAEVRIAYELAIEDAFGEAQLWK